MMRRFFLSFFCAVLLVLPSFVFAQGMEINTFIAEMEISQQGILTVEERIEVEFNEPRHGIFREIPTAVRLDGWRRSTLELDLKEVIDENGEAYPFTEEKGLGKVLWRIGDADTLISGRHMYQVKYEVKNAVRFLKDHDELYWNVTGTEWEAPISQSGTRISLPFLAGQKLQLACFTGPQGSTAADCTFEQQGNDAVFNAQDFLTVVVGWPKGLIDEPSAAQKFSSFLWQNAGFVLPFIAFAIMYALWNKYGRDPKGRGVVRQYEAPDDLSPLEMSYLLKNRFDPQAISAEVIHLAVLGYVKIEEKISKAWIGQREEYLLHRLTGIKPLKPHQQRLLQDLFKKGNPVSMTDLENSFYKSIKPIGNQVYQQLHEKQYYQHKPDHWKGKVFGAVFLFWWIIFFFGGFFLLGRIDVIVGLIISSFIVLVFGWLMPQRTPQGVAAYEYAQGFKQYLAAAETERVKFQEKQNLFFDYLPYAMVFGIGAKWAKAFAGLITQPPEWYQGTWSHGFSPVYFSQSVNSFSSFSAEAFAPPHSSSSSGFSGGSSGGGSGGGGGGSW